MRAEAENGTFELRTFSFFLKGGYGVDPGTFSENADEPIKEVKIGGSLGCINHTLIEFLISRNTDLAKRPSQDPELSKSELPAV